MKAEQEAWANLREKYDSPGVFHFYNFFISQRVAEMFLPGRQHVHVRIVPDEAGDYFTWWDSEKDTFNFTAPAEVLVEVCFAYGSKAEEERGRGRLIRCRIERVG